jgi:hypothetical protein
MFVPTTSTTALFMPPYWWRLFGGWGARLEDFGARICPTFAGVLIVEAEKQIYATPIEPVRARKARVLAPVRPIPADPPLPRQPS